MCQKEEEDMSSYSEGQTHQLMDALEAAGYEPADITRLGQFNNHPGILDVLRGRAEIVMIKRDEVPLDTIIRVNRSIRPEYPDWVERVVHPELESTGPAEYDLAATSLWLHDRQRDGVAGQVIYDHLKQHGMLASCLSLQDAMEIQNKGVAVFRQVFGDQFVYFWKSVVQSRDARYLYVPSLGVLGDQVVLRWHWLGLAWRVVWPAVRFVR